LLLAENLETQDGGLKAAATKTLAGGRIAHVAAIRESPRRAQHAAPLREKAKALRH
jgi:hypothetical protein